MNHQTHWIVPVVLLDPAHDEFLRIMVEIFSWNGEGSIELKSCSMVRRRISIRWCGRFRLPRNARARPPNGERSRLCLRTSLFKDDRAAVSFGRPFAADTRLSTSPPFDEAQVCGKCRDWVQRPIISSNSLSRKACMVWVRTLPNSARDVSMWRTFVSSLALKMSTPS